MCGNKTPQYRSNVGSNGDVWKINRAFAKPLEFI